MKKIKYIIFALFVVSSFYLTDKIMMYIDNKNPLMQEIVSVMKDYNTEPTNAIIEKDTIIPGLTGKEVNKHSSLVKMEEFGSFNETYLIYNTIKPDISLEDNKDKIIISGNPIKRNISLILEENNELELYLIQNKIKYDIVTNLKTDLTKAREYINGEESYELASDLHSLLNKKKINKKICLFSYSNITFCKEHGYYLIKHSLNITDNYKLNNGDIILAPKSTSLTNLKDLIIKANHLDLSFVYLSELVLE